MIVVPDPVRRRIGPPGMRIGVDVFEYFAAFFVHASGAGRFEPGVLEEPKQRVNRRSPWTGAPSDRASDARGVAQISADEGHFLHGGDSIEVLERYRPELRQGRRRPASLPGPSAPS